MKENEWVSLKERLPGIEEPVNLKSEHEPSTICQQLEFKLFHEKDFYKWKNLSNGHIARNPTHFRPIPEKCPDFSKIKKGDLVYISHKDSGYDQVGFYCGQSDGSIILCRFKDLDCLQYRYEACDKIKKITRINIEKQTFEEI